MTDLILDHRLRDVIEEGTEGHLALERKAMVRSFPAGPVRQ